MLKLMKRVFAARSRQWSRRTAVVGVIGLCLLLIGGGGVYAALGGATRTTDSGDIDLQKGLVGWWKMDGNAKDSTPYSNNGTVNTGVSLTSDRKSTANAAYSFAGTTSAYITLPASTAYDNAQVTASAWVYATSSSTSVTAVSRWDSAGPFSGNWALGQGSVAGTWRFMVCNNSGTATAQSATNFSLNTWHHLVGVFDGTNAILYVDGTAAATTPRSGGGLPATTTQLRIGSKSSNDSKWPGNLDDVRVYNRGISATEVSTLYKTYDSKVAVAAGENGLLGWWKMDGNAKDSAPNHNNGTLSGTTKPSLTTDREGAANSAYSFNGSTAWISAGTPASMQLGNSLSLSAWIKPTAYNSTSWFGLANVFVSKSDTSSSTINYQLQLDSDTILSFVKRTGAEGIQYYHFTVPSMQNHWSHVAFTVNGTTGTLYLNGASVGTATVGSLAGTGSQILSVGASAAIGTSQTVAFTGSIDDVRVYGRPLSASEVANQYASYSAGLQPDNLSTGLVGDYPFNGNAKDATPYRNHGALTSMTLTTDRKGRANSAYSFNGTNSKISSNLSFPSSQVFSMSAWINTTTNTVNQAIIAALQSTSPELRISSNGRLYLTQPANGVVCNGLSTVPANQWVHVAVTYNASASACQFYVNGSSVSTSAGTTQTFVASNLEIGAWGASGEPFSGSIDDARVWNRILSASEVSAIYNTYR